MKVYIQFLADREMATHSMTSQNISETKTGSHESRNIFLTFLEHDLFWHCNLCRSSIQIQVTIHALRTNQSPDRNDAFDGWNSLLQCAHLLLP